ncbi:MAG: hypothetical protein SH857_17610 [Chitinophagales bacterium]|nr:hypothetical protein [Chitinophagales bacterium]
MASLNLLYTSLLESRTVIFLGGKQMYNDYQARLEEAKAWMKKNLWQ